MGKLDPDAQPFFNIGQFDPCLPWFPRIKPAFRFATRAVIISSSFFLKVLYADVIDTGSIKNTSILTTRQQTRSVADIEIYWQTSPSIRGRS
jgi:hypothetical protein